MAPRNDIPLVDRKSDIGTGEILQLINNVMDRPNDIKAIGKVYKKYTEYKNKIGSILNGNEKQEKDYANEILISSEELFSQTTQLAIEENSGKISSIEQTILNDGIGHLNSFFDADIFDKLEKSGVEEFDEFIKNVIKGEITNIFTKNKDKLIEDLIRNFDYSHVDILTSDLEKLVLKGYIDENFINEARQALLNKYLESIFPELKKKIDDVFAQIDEAIEKNDIIAINPEEILDNFGDDIQEIRDTIESGTDVEEELKKITEEFEQNLFKKINKLQDKYFNQVITKDIEDFETKADFDEYESNQEFKSWIKDIKFIFDYDSNFELKEREDAIAFFTRKYTTLKREILLRNTGKIVPIKKKGDLVYFGDVSFPVYKRERQSSNWKLDPKIDNDNVVINFRELKSGLQMKPSDHKRLFSDFELSKNDYKTLVQEYEQFKKTGDYSELLSRKKELISRLQETRIAHKVSLSDEDNILEIVQIKEELQVVKDKLKEGIPHIFGIIETLNRLNLSHYGDVPGLSDKIKITPYILDNLKKVISLAKDQLIRKDGIGILEGEAGVGKNVLIDIFAHYTNRPVFKFPCNNRASKEDLTYQWLINENGTYKLHSKVYEAIRTPGAILIFDEINTLPAEVIKLLNGLFDYNRTLTMPYDNEYQKAQGDVIIFGTQNPTHYLGTKSLPQDTTSRSNIAYIDYPELESDKNGTNMTNFDEALITYANMPYYYKLLEVKGHSKDDLNKFFNLRLKEESNQELTQEEQEFVSKINKDLMTEQEFVDAWNNIYNFSKEEELKQTHGEEFVKGIKDIHELIGLANVIRKRYKDKMEGINKTDYITVSVSQRDLNKMMGQLCEGKTPKEAFLNCYSSLIPDVGTRAKVVAELK